MLMPWKVIIYRSKGKKMLEDWELQMIKDIYKEVAINKIKIGLDVLHDEILDDAIEATANLSLLIETGYAEDMFLTEQNKTIKKSED